MTETQRLYRRNLMNNGRCVITATDDTGGVHKVQVRATPRELIDDVPVVQLYGVASHAQVGSEAHMVCARGDRSSTVVVATNNADARLRNLQPGEVGIYTDEGDTIILRRGHQIEITTTGTVTVDAPLMVLTGDLHVQGEVIRGYGGPDSVTLGKHSHQQGSDTHGDGEVPTNAPTAGT
jgi:phage baseplate assembly protein V